MKRSPIIVAILLLLCLTVMPVSAAQTGVTMQSVEATVGEIVYLPLSLEETQEANTVGIGLTFDRSALEFVASRSTWSISGTMQSFDRQREYALWADSKTQSLSGELCRLAFRVKEGAKASQCSVTCSVVLKIDTQEVASYTATGEIALRCQHSYGEWTKLNDNAHVRTCQLCGVEEFASHEWDEGTVTKEPTQTQTGTRVLTCQLCGAEREEQIPALGSPEATRPTETPPVQSEPTRPQTTQPTRPQTTQPTQPQTTQPTQPQMTQPTQPQTTQPTQPQTTQPTQPGDQSGNGNSGFTTTVPTQPGSGQESTQESQPLVVPKEDVVVIRPDGTILEPSQAPETVPETVPEAQPVAESEKTGWSGAVTVAVCLLAVAGGTGFWLVKKRKQ